MYYWFWWDGYGRKGTHSIRTKRLLLKRAVKPSIQELMLSSNGGEDAKVTYLGQTAEHRMNGSCAGGTGAFIDQMATFLRTDASGLNQLAMNADTIYPIAAPCGVFAKTDVQALKPRRISRKYYPKSVFQAIVNQTIAGLASRS